MIVLRDWLQLAHFTRLSAHRMWERWSRLGDVQAVLADSAVKETPSHTLEAEYRCVSQWLARDTAHHALTWADAEYPALWRTLPDPPPLIYVWGNLEALTLPAIAVVGSRSATAEGLGLAREWAFFLARAGLCIVSGLALGIDGIAHQATLDAQGVTVALLGGGLCKIHPKKHQGLADRIVAQGGAMVSEFPLHLSPASGHFPRRNRLISGLSRGVLVIEAALRSGSLVTARLATEQGRDVFVIPGSVRNPQAAGCHCLLQEGAMLVTSPADILTEWGINCANKLNFVTKPEIKLLDMDIWLEEERILYSLLDFNPQTALQLGGRLGWSEQKMTKFLLTLELKGVIKRTFIGYQRVKI